MDIIKNMNKIINFKLYNVLINYSCRLTTSKTDRIIREVKPVKN